MTSKIIYTDETALAIALAKSKTEAEAANAVYHELKKLGLPQPETVEELKTLCSNPRKFLEAKICEHIEAPPVKVLGVTLSRSKKKIFEDLELPDLSTVEALAKKT